MMISAGLTDPRMKIEIEVTAHRETVLEHAKIDMVRIS